uniref:Uncharacterized protein n=1 Tax=Magallana gigas TaxID=29159 RepID=A0A8W8ITW8_MAGGI
MMSMNAGQANTVKQMSKSAQQSTHASITGLASIIMAPTLVNVLRDGRGKTVRKILTNVFHPRVITMAAV